jgi:hypothetical protein
MDLSTMRRKLDTGEYPGPDKFYDDFRLMIRNCFTFNPAGTAVNQAGIELQQVFDDRWKNLPPLRPDVSEEDEEDEDESEDERSRMFRSSDRLYRLIRNLCRHNCNDGNPNGDPSQFHIGTQKLEANQGKEKEGEGVQECVVIIEGCTYTETTESARQEEEQAGRCQR